ncbi:MAG: glycosyltransferase family 39 protein [Chloroflexota bacterium]
MRAPTLGAQSLWRDEVDAIRFSSWPLKQLLEGLFLDGHNGPLFFLFLRGWRTLMGDSEFSLRYPSLFFGVLIVGLGASLARQLQLGRRAEILIALLLATSPYLIWYSQEAKMYTMLLVFVTLAFVAYLKALHSTHSSGIWWIVFVVATSLSFYTHILSPLMLFVYGFVALLYRFEWQQHWRGWFISMACLSLPYIPLAWWQLPLLFKDFTSGHPFYSFQDQFSLLLQLYSSGLIPLVEVIPILAFVFLLLSGIFLGVPSRLANGSKTGQYSYKKRAALITWVLLPPLIVYLVSLRVPVFEDRYMIYITPPFYLVGVLGLILIRQHQRWVASFCLGLILMVNVVGIWQQQRRPIKADFRGAAAK